MKILFLSEQFPFPLYDGGNLRTFHVLRGLAREHDVTLVAHAVAENREEAEQSVSRFCNVVAVPEPSVPTRAVANLIRLGPGCPLFVIKNWSPTVLAAADRLLAEQEFDAIHLNMLDTAGFALARKWNKPLVFDSHNCLAQIASGVSEKKGSVFRRLLYGHEAKALARYEGRVAGRVNLTLVCSENDSKLFSKLNSQANCLVAPNGVDSSYFHGKEFEDQGFERGACVFTGSMSYFPNEEASIWFVNEVMPKLSGHEIKVYLVGRTPPPSVKALHDGDQVVVTGTVDDVRPYVGRAEVFVVPLLTGGGTRLKILEAFAMGKAVVSTRKGAEGIPAEHGKQILYADTPDEFAEAIGQLLTSPDKRDQLGAAARSFVESRYDWNAVQDIILRGYEKLCSSNAS